MNSITSHEPDKDQVVDARQKQQEAKNELVGSLKLKKGHTLFEVNLDKKTIAPAKFEEQLASFVKESNQIKPNGLGVLVKNNGQKRVVIDGPSTTRKVLIRKEGCIYISALNHKNCLRKLENRGVIKMKSLNKNK